MNTTPGLTEKQLEAVRLFHRLMISVLEANAWKGGWEETDPEDLMQRLEGEVEELRNAVKSRDVRQIAREAADVANYAMMVVDSAFERWVQDHQEDLKDIVGNQG